MPAWTYRPTLYVKSTLEDARLRALLEVKGAPAEVIEVTTPAQEIALAELNTERVYPVLIDRELVVYGSALDEYINERWPGPSLVPQEPIHRAQARMLVEWVKQWYRLPQHQQHAHLRSVEEVFQRGNKFFFGEQVTIVDVALAPLLASDDYEPTTTSFADYMARLSPASLRMAA